MRKLLIASALLALALPVAASAETITTGVSNSVGSSVFCGSTASSSKGDYTANGTIYTMTYANKQVASGYDDASAGSFKSNEAKSVSSPGKSTEVSEANLKDNNHDAHFSDRKETENAGTTTTIENKDVNVNSTQTHLGGITEQSGSLSVTNAGFNEHHYTDSFTSGKLVQFSANSSVSSFASTGI